MLVAIVRPGAAVLTLALVAFCATSSASSATKSARRELGTIHVPAHRAGEQVPDPDRRKMLIVRGRVLTGEIVASYADGKSWLGDVLWQPTPQPPVPPRPKSIDPAELTDGDMSMFDDVPSCGNSAPAGWRETWPSPGSSIA